MYPLGVALPILMTLDLTPYCRSRFASPRSSSGLPLMSFHGASSIAWSAAKIALEVISSSVAEGRANISEQAHAQARLPVLGFRNKRNSRLTGALRPVPPTASATAISGSQTSASRSWISCGISGQVMLDPFARAQLSRRLRTAWPCPAWMRRRNGSTRSPWCRRRIRMMTDRDRIVSGNQPRPAKATAAIGGDFLGHDLLAPDHAPAGYGAAAMAGVEESANLFILLRLGAEHRVDLVEQDRGAFLATNLAEEIGRGDVHRRHRVGHQQLGSLERPGFPRCRLGRQEGNARRGFPCVHQVGVHNPKRMRHMRVVDG